MNPLKLTCESGVNIVSKEVRLNCYKFIYCRHFTDTVHFCEYRNAAEVTDLDGPVPYGGCTLRGGCRRPLTHLFEVALLDALSVLHLEHGHGTQSSMRTAGQGDRTFLMHDQEFVFLRTAVGANVYIINDRQNVWRSLKLRC